MLEKIKDIVAEILNIDKGKIDPETDLIRDLEAESIDLLEIALSLEKEFGIKVDENKIFLKSLRFYIDEAKEKGKDVISYLREKYPFLERERIKQIAEEAKKQKILPSVKIKDLISYVQYKRAHKEEKEYKEV